MAETSGNACGRIYQAIPAIMGELDAVEKKKANTQQHFMYRGIDDVMNAINPALVKNKVFIVPEIMEQTREERTSNKGGNLIYSICKMKFHFCADDGSSVEAVTIGEGMDSGDKATNKAMSVAFKYACFQIFCIPTEEMRDADPDAESFNVQARGNGADRGSGGRNSTGQGNNAPQAESRTQGNIQPQRAADKQADAQMVEQANNSLIDAPKIKVIKDTIQKKGLSDASILGHYKIQRFEDMTFGSWNNAMQLLKKYPDKEGRK